MGTTIVDPFDEGNRLKGILVRELSQTKPITDRHTRPWVAHLLAEVKLNLAGAATEPADTTTTIERTVEVIDLCWSERQAGGTGAAMLALVDTGPEKAVEAVRLGAHAVVTEYDGIEPFTEALTAAMSGQRYSSPIATEWIFDAVRTFTPNDDRTAATLTGRELEVLSALREGLSVKQTASRLGLAPKTVEAHRSRAFAKLGVRNRQQAALVLSDQNHRAQGSRRWER